MGGVVAQAQGRDNPAREKVMPRTCTVCRHKKRAEIDRALVDGGSIRDISGHYRLTKSAIERHKAEHVPERLAQAKEAHAVANAGSLLERLEELTQDARRIQQKAEAKEDYRSALAGVRELVRIVELLAELEGKLNRSAQVSVIVSPEWLLIRSKIMQALVPFPEAAQAVAKVLNDNASA